MNSGAASTGYLRTPLDPKLCEAEPDWFWTIQLFESGFSLQECCKVRHVTRAEILEDVFNAMENGTQIRRQWIFSSERWAQLSETLRNGNMDFSGLTNDAEDDPAANTLEVVIFAKLAGG